MNEKIKAYWFDHISMLVESNAALTIQVNSLNTELNKLKEIKE